MMTEEKLLQKLRRPCKIVDVVLDTDAYNEVDDQFALAYLLRSPERVSLKAVYAAPFWNDKSSGPADGMEKSYFEIFHILHLAGEHDLDQQVFRGSDRYLSDESVPVESPAARDLVQRAMAYPEDNPLYVVAIGAITNIASVLLMEPQLRDHMVVIWLGGHSWSWPSTDEFNMVQDIAAARVVFESGVPLIQVPCMGVADRFALTGPELVYWLKGQNELCDYLVNIVTEEAQKCEAVCQNGGLATWSRVIWDVTAAAWLMGEDLERDLLEHTPIPQYDSHYSFDCRRQLMRCVYQIDRDRLAADLFAKLRRG